MLFQPKNLVKTTGRFVIPNTIMGKASRSFEQPILREFWQNFTYGRSDISLETTDEVIFSIGGVAPLSYGKNAYSIRVTSDGIGIAAPSVEDLLRGYMTLLDRIVMDDDGTVYIDCFTLCEKPSVERRMVHFCVFPETELWELQRFLRLCGALKYTHVVLEFWGMLKYDALAELSWEHGFDKEQIRPLIAEARALGLEIVPMFNHWGHASQARVMHGKHVILDQAPQLQYLFGEDGWRWNIKNTAVRRLHAAIRRELCDLCGAGSYFHIGCDEAYGFGYTDAEVDEVADYINEVNDDLRTLGRKTIMWADMLLCREHVTNAKNRYSLSAPDRESAEKMLSRIDRTILLADWQYECAEAPIETALILKQAGFEVLLCPWDRGYASIDACLETVKQHSLSGILHTTWHTLSANTDAVTKAAVESWSDTTEAYPCFYRTQTAALLRKVCPVCGDYRRAGWAKKEIGVITL